ncbi:SDR family oxidoreductase [Actinophytocola glycyrrhizae]|uniref:SDR family oxidoreductase n=1 Tax=Actinophytocola glycyrrhizae TaxID=2044873 RepID=A0ABV9RV68_9PSEU
MTGELVEQVRLAVPLGRPGEPSDIADAVVFLASHQARWITGQVLQVAGGHARTVKWLGVRPRHQARPHTHAAARDGAGPMP